MKYLFSLLFVFMLLAGCKDEKNQQLLSIDSIDQYAVIKHVKEKKTFEFKVTNTSSSRIISLNEIVKSCGCIDYNISSKSILPKETISILVTVSQEHFGKNTNWILLVSDENAKSDLCKYRLSLTTEIFPNFVIKPSLVSKKLYRFQTKQSNVKFFIYDDTSISSVESSVDWLSLSELLPFDKGYEIVLTFNTDQLTEGIYKSDVVINTVRGDCYSVPVILEVLSDVSVMPDKVFIGYKNRNQTFQSKFIEVSVCGKKPRGLDVKISPTGLFKCDIVEEKDHVRIYIEDQVDKDVQGLINAKIYLNFRDYPETIIVPVSGYVN